MTLYEDLEEVGRIGRYDQLMFEENKSGNWCLLAAQSCKHISIIVVATCSTLEELQVWADIHIPNINSYDVKAKHRII